MRIKEIKVRNFRTLKDITMSDIPGFSVIVGANGSGKTTLIGIFEFLRDCLKDNVRSALLKRGGFKEVISRGCPETDTIYIELAVQLDLLSDKSRIVRYILEIGIDAGKANRPIIRTEILQYRRGERGQPFRFINFSDGEGGAVAETLDNFDLENVSDEDLEREQQSLDSPDILAIKGLGQFKKFDAASQLRDLIENWNVSDFHITDARVTPEASYAEHLNVSGDNLALVAQFLSEYHPETYSKILEHMASRVPGIKSIKSESTTDGRVALKFQDAAFEDAFIARAVSDGTIKMFAYLILLYDPNPHPLLCVEEPENQLYPTLLTVLAEEFATYAERRNGKGQVFVTTHSPDFLNAVDLDSIFWFEKQDGFSKIHRARDNKQLVALVQEGDQPGELWRQDLFDGASPQ